MDPWTRHRFFKSLDRVHDIKTDPDPERRKKCKRFGVKAIVFSILAVGFAFCANLLTAPHDGEELFLWIVFGIGLGFGLGVGGPIIMIGSAIFNWFCQLSVNRRAITWISLLFIIAAIAGALLVYASILGSWGAQVA